jgi:hypothetical protein
MSERQLLRVLVFLIFSVSHGPGVAKMQGN